MSSLFQQRPATLVVMGCNCGVECIRAITDRAPRADWALIAAPYQKLIEAFPIGHPRREIACDLDAATALYKNICDDVARRVRVETILTAIPPKPYLIQNANRVERMLRVLIKAVRTDSVPQQDIIVGDGEDVEGFVERLQARMVKDADIAAATMTVADMWTTPFETRIYLIPRRARAVDLDRIMTDIDIAALTKPDGIRLPGHGDIRSTDDPRTIRFVGRRRVGLVRMVPDWGPRDLFSDDEPEFRPRIASSMAVVGHDMDPVRAMSWMLNCFI